MEEMLEEILQLWAALQTGHLRILLWNPAMFAAPYSPTFLSGFLWLSEPGVQWAGSPAKLKREGLLGTDLEFFPGLVWHS